MARILKKLAKLLFSISREKVIVNIYTSEGSSSLYGKNIIVTGASRGIGFAIAQKCISLGATVIITGRKERSLSDVCNRLGGKCKYLVFDNMNFDEYPSFLSKSEEIFGGGISAIVLNAGVSLHEGNFLNVTLNGFTEQMDTNLKSGFFFAQEYIKKQLEQKREGNVLFVSSETAAKCNDLPYGLSKVAINSLVGGIARRVYKRGIRVNAIAPGVTLTDMTAKGKNCKSHEDDLSNNSVAGRYLLPEEIAEIACFLLSDVSKCISGEILYCDAGSHLKINGTENEYSF